MNSTKSILPAALSADESARYIGVGRTTLYELYNNGLIKSVLVKTRRGNVSGRRVFLRASLDAYLRSLAQ